MGVKFGCRVNNSLVRFGTLQEAKWSEYFLHQAVQCLQCDVDTHWLLMGTMGELEKRSVAPPLLLALPTDWVLGDTLGV